MEAVYSGNIYKNDYMVFKDGFIIKSSPENRTMTWGYIGGGVAQLALLMLINECGYSFNEAKYKASKFAYSYLSSLPDDWQLTSKQIQFYASQISNTSSQTEIK